MRLDGMTLIELLVIMAILGILVSIVLFNYNRWRANSAVRQGAVEFTQAVDRTRTGAKRLNACQDLQLAATTDATTLKLDIYGTASCTGTPTSTATYAMPPGVTISLTSGGANSMKFVPPYGTTSAAPMTFEVRWAANTAIKQPVRLTGVFGRVILK